MTSIILSFEQRDRLTVEFKQFINSHPTINETYKTKGLIEIGIYLKSTGSWTGEKITDK